MKSVILHGKLAKLYKKEYKLDVNSPAEAVRALIYQLKDFAENIREGEFFVKLDNKKIDETELTMNSNCNTIHIIPTVKGSKRNGILKVILGVVLIGVGFAVAGGAFGAVGSGMSATLMGITAKTFIVMGAGMLFNGISQMISPTTSIDSSESADNKPSYIFNSAINLSKEGNIIPVCYGNCWAGSLVISSGMDVNEV